MSDLDHIYDCLRPSVKPKSRSKILACIEKSVASDHAKDLARTAINETFNVVEGKHARVYPQIIASRVELLSLQIRAGVLD